MTVVESTAGEADAAAGDLAVGAGHTRSELLSHSNTEVAETERIGANADNSAVSGARRTGRRGSVTRARV